MQFAHGLSFSSSSDDDDATKDPKSGGMAMAIILLYGSHEARNLEPDNKRFRCRFEK
jgi:hypothetical protein